MNAFQTLCSLLLILVSSHLCLVHGYKLGDNYRTEWSEVPLHESPRFGLERVVRLTPLTEAKEYTPTDSFKFSFRFAEERLLVPWITVTDGQNHYIQKIDFYFTYTQGYINQVKWQVTYWPLINAAGAAHKPDHVLFHYHWYEELESDPAFTMNLFMFITIIFTWIMSVLILLEFDRSVIIPKGMNRLMSSDGVSSFSSSSSSSSASSRLPPPANPELATSSWTAKDAQHAL